MQVIGVCGGSGSGKGELCRLFAEIGIPSIDTDALYHDMTAGRNSLTEALAARFGEDILDENGALCRSRLAAKVFAPDASAELADLNRIAHFHILAGVRVWLAECKEKGLPAALVDAPLLFESGFDRECDVIIGVTAPKDLRILRIMQRDKISAEDAERRIAAQQSDAYLIERCGYHIINAGDIDSLRMRVREIAKEILDK
ncbi:MAG: dephospho-CoA kinase [Clostridia bacterium]|nr:dephospho-CoA kinase [Clostridia bacterium]